MASFTDRELRNAIKASKAEGLEKNKQKYENAVSSYNSKVKGAAQALADNTHLDATGRRNLSNSVLDAASALSTIEWYNKDLNYITGAKGTDNTPYENALSQLMNATNQRNAYQAQFKDQRDMDLFEYARGMDKDALEADIAKRTAELEGHEANTAKFRWAPVASSNPDIDLDIQNSGMADRKKETQADYDP